jgi:hypothetical protein
MTHSAGNEGKLALALDRKIRTFVTIFLIIGLTTGNGKTARGNAPNVLRVSEAVPNPIVGDEGAYFYLL